MERGLLGVMVVGVAFCGEGEWEGIGGVVGLLEFIFALNCLRNPGGPVLRPDSRDGWLLGEMGASYSLVMRSTTWV
jgi:hypothetical protein